MNVVSKALAVAGAMVILAQMIRPERTNPKVTKALDAPADVSAILHRGCFDCHSNETVWPWYSEFAPVSWLVARDVAHGRRHLNFSTWDRYEEDPGTVAEKLDKIRMFVNAEKMPLWFYLPMHSSARLTPADREAIARWATTEIDRIQRASGVTMQEPSK